MLIALSALFVFGLFGAVFALSVTNTSAEKTEAICPMHKQTPENAFGGNHNDSCCGMADCCKDGKCSMGGSCCKDRDSCPTKELREKESAQTIKMSKIIVVSDGDSCCKPGADCCKGGACCHKKS